LIGLVEEIVFRQPFRMSAMDFDDLITKRPPPPNRRGKTVGDEQEHHFYGAR